MEISFYAIFAPNGGAVISLESDVLLNLQLILARGQFSLSLDSILSNKALFYVAYQSTLTSLAVQSLIASAHSAF